MVGNRTELPQTHMSRSQAILGAPAEILTAEEAGLRLKLPLSTVYYLAKTGALPGFQLGRSWRFAAAELDRLVQRQPKSARVLVVTDEAATRRFIENALSVQLGTVAEAANVNEALAAVRREPFDLFLVDLKMPADEGLRLVRHIAGDYSLAQVVMLASFTDLAQADELLQLGPVTLLCKPLDAVQLTECVSWILRARPQQSLSARKKLPGKEVPAAGNKCPPETNQPVSLALNN